MYFNIFYIYFLFTFFGKFSSGRDVACKCKGVLELAFIQRYDIAKPNGNGNTRGTLVRPLHLSRPLSDRCAIRDTLSVQFAKTIG